jgi:hypothetical protein
MARYISRHNPKRTDGRDHLPPGLFKEFIAQQLSKREADDDESDRVVVHADCGFGEAS